MKRALVVGGVVLLVAIVAIGVYLYNSIDSIVETAITKYGSQILGTDVHVGSVDISLKSGRGTIRDIRVGNPDGFGSGNAFQLDELTLDVQVASLNKDPIVIEEIDITGPEANVVFNSKAESNLGTIKKNVDDYQVSSKGHTTTKGDSGYEKRFLIRSFRFEQGEVKADATELGQGTVEADLPPVRLNDLGGPNGAPPDAIGKAVAQAFLGAVMGAVGDELADRAKGEAKDEAVKALDKLLK